LLPPLFSRVADALTILPPTVPFSVLVALALGLLYELLNAEVAVPPLLAAVPANRGHGRPGTVIVVCILVLLSSEALDYRWRWRLRRFA
jgi:hypothetical protein